MGEFAYLLKRVVGILAAPLASLIPYLSNTCAHLVYTWVYPTSARIGWSWTWHRSIVAEIARSADVLDNTVLVLLTAPTGSQMNIVASEAFVYLYIIVILRTLRTLPHLMIRFFPLWLSLNLTLLTYQWLILSLFHGFEEFFILSRCCLDCWILF
jgi:hypothetical protein